MEQYNRLKTILQFHAMRLWFTATNRFREKPITHFYWYSQKQWERKSTEKSIWGVPYKNFDGNIDVKYEEEPIYKNFINDKQYTETIKFTDGISDSKDARIVAFGRGVREDDIKTHKVR